MSPKLILAVSGAALVPAVAVPTSISLTPNSQEALVEPEKQQSQAVKAKKHKSLKSLPKRKTGASNDYYMSKYQGYFLDSGQNKDLWEEKFKNITGSEGQIKILDDEDAEWVIIDEPWDGKHDSNYYENRLRWPLNVFCGKGYETDGGEWSGTWKFDISYTEGNVYASMDMSKFWQLCSAFNNKPKTLSEDQTLLKSRYSNSRHIGNQLQKSVVITHGDNDEFWNNRQEEWQDLENPSSTYFQYQPGKSIRSLCESAYKQEPAQGQDSKNAPTLDNAKKYCSLEWDF